MNSDPDPAPRLVQCPHRIWSQAKTRWVAVRNPLRCSLLRDSTLVRPPLSASMGSSESLSLQITARVLCKTLYPAPGLHDLRGFIEGRGVVAYVSGSGAVASIHCSTFSVLQGQGSLYH